MSYTYTSTNRHFITNPYIHLDSNNQPYTSQQLLDYLSTIDKNQFNIDGFVITKEYTINEKFIYPVIAFYHEIFTPTGKFKKSFIKILENKSFEETYLPPHLSETTQENWS